MAPPHLDPAELQLLHASLLHHHGGTKGVRDEQALHAVIATPIDADPFTTAAEYAYRIAHHYPFVAGNTRTALCAALVLLALSGRQVHDPDGHLADTMLAAAEQRLDPQTLAREFAARPGQRFPSGTDDHLELADNFITYFERLSAENHQQGHRADYWDNAAHIAHEWRRQILLATHTPTEVAALLAMLGQSNKESTGFIVMRGYVRAWARDLDRPQCLAHRLDRVLHTHAHNFKKLTPDP